MKRFLTQSTQPKIPIKKVENVLSSDVIMDEVDTNDLTDCPDDMLLSEAARDYSGRRRQPQAKWFSNHPWLRISRQRKVLLCSWCREMGNKRLVGACKVESAFVDKGFNNWKDGSIKLDEHAASSSHRAAAEYVSNKSKPSVATQLSCQLAKEQQVNRNRLVVQLNSLMFLMRQGLAIRRGKDEKNDNLHQLIQMMTSNISGDASTSVGLQKGIHLSHDIVNEQCNIIGKTLLRMVIERFNANKAVSQFAILADETRDVSGAEQLSVCIRWTNMMLAAQEDFLGLYSLKGFGQKAEILAACLIDVMTRCQLSFSELHGQGYDGASAMSGAISGVAQRMKERSPNAHFVHCLAHCLNLAVAESGKSVPFLSGTLEFVQHIVTFIRNSGKRTDMLRDVQSQFVYNEDEEQHVSAPVTNLRPLCPTRWTVRASAINSVICNYEHLMETFERIVADRKTPSDAAYTERGLLNTLHSAETYFKCSVAHRLFALTDSFATAIQSPTMTISEVMRRKRHVLSELTVLRNQFEIMFDAAVNEAKRMDLEDIKLPRRRRVPASIVEGDGEQFQFDDIKAFQRSHYYEAVDSLYNTISWRLDDQSLKPASTLEQLLRSATVGPQIDENLLEEVVCFHPHLNPINLKSELALLSHNNIADNIPAIIAWFNDADVRRDTHKTIYSAVATLVMLPSTTSSCERSFSGLRRLKTYLRSTMGQERLNSIMMSNVHLDLMDSINIVSVANEFASLNDLRKKLYGHFS